MGGKKPFGFLFSLSLVLGGCVGPARIPMRSPAQQASPVCDVRAYGAQGNGRDLDTAAIQSAVNDCRGRNGTVHFSPGTYLTAMITLGSAMTVQLDAGAVLLGVQDGDSAYPDLNPSTHNGQLLNCRKALLYADQATDLTIEGPGRIDGNGAWPSWGNGVKEAKRPMAIFIVKSTNLSIRNLEVRNAAMWAVVLMETQHTRVDGLNIDSRVGPTRDGIDIVDGTDIVIDHVTVNSEDDSICLKSGISGGLQGITVRNSHVLGSLVANGLKFGTASVGPLRNAVFENIVIEHVQQAAMAIESVDGSQIQGVRFRNITFHDVGTAIYALLGWRGDPGNPRPGSLENLSFQDVSGESTRQSWGSAISGTQIQGVIYAPSNLVFQNVSMSFRGNGAYQGGHLPLPPPEYRGQYPDPRLWGDLPAAGLYFRHAKAIHLDHVNLTDTVPLDQRPMIVPGGAQADFDAP